MHGDGCMYNILLLLLSSLVLLQNPHDINAMYKRVQSLDGQGKIAEAFTEVTSLLRINPKVNGFMTDTLYMLVVQDCPTTYHELKGKIPNLRPN